MTLPKALLVTFFLGFLITFQSQAQNERDTVYYEIKTEMVDAAEIHKETIDDMEYYTIAVQLEEEYYREFEQLTDSNVGSLLAVVHEDEIISPSFPIILTEIHSGRIQISEFDKEEKAREIMRQILNKEE